MRRRRTCSICRQPGHWATRCPNRGAQPSPAPRPSAAPEGTETRRFDSLGDLLETLKQPALHSNAAIEARRARGSEWTGNASLAQALAMLAGQGCPELAERVRDLAIDMLPHVRVTPSLGEAYDVAGSQVDIGRYLEGDPECMVDYVSPMGAAKTFDVYANLSVSGSVSTSLIEQRGAAICAVIDALETSGTRVRLWACEITENHKGYRLEITMLVKDYHAPLDIDLVAFVLAHPAMVRQLVFRVFEQTPALAYECLHGAYGYPAEMTVPGDAVYLPSMISDKARLWAIDPLAAVQRIFNGGSLS